MSPKHKPEIFYAVCREGKFLCAHRTKDKCKDSKIQIEAGFFWSDKIESALRARDIRKMYAYARRVTSRMRAEVPVKKGAEICEITVTTNRFLCSNKLKRKVDHIMVGDVKDGTPLYVGVSCKVGKPVDRPSKAFGYPAIGSIVATISQVGDIVCRYTLIRPVRQTFMDAGPAQSNILVAKAG